jgi:beta-fructofuranosidase
VSFSDEVAKPNTVVSRGVSAGVSEKSNTFLSAAGNKVGGESESFPWNNTMLSWQRTSFHFQPEKNWMNGNSNFHFQ